jgi:hypothetical protein
VRRRLVDDLPDCVRTLKVVHSADGYPVLAPEQ